jgi:hypothetical protein
MPGEHLSNPSLYVLRCVVLLALFCPTSAAADDFVKDPLKLQPAFSKLEVLLGELDQLASKHRAEGFSQLNASIDRISGRAHQLLDQADELANSSIVRAKSAGSSLIDEADARIKARLSDLAREAEGLLREVHKLVSQLECLATRVPQSWIDLMATYEPTLEAAGIELARVRATYSSSLNPKERFDRIEQMYLESIRTQTPDASIQTLIDRFSELSRLAHQTSCMYYRGESRETGTSMDLAMRAAEYGRISRTLYWAKKAK